MMVGGHADATGRQPTSVVAWSCGPGGSDERRRHRTALTPTGLRLWVTFPDCWDGVHLDSADHHVTSPTATTACATTTTRYRSRSCSSPSTTRAADSASFSLASGSTDTAHADFWNAWDQHKLAGEVDLCLHRDLVCGVSRTDNRTF